MLCEAWHAGVALCGVSAGARGWFEAGAQGLTAGVAAAGCLLRFAGTELAEVVASQPGARAYRVAPSTDSAQETPLPATLLP
jgi:hypothetical protein